jgi:hypothetical protein
MLDFVTATTGTSWADALGDHDDLVEEADPAPRARLEQGAALDLTDELAAEGDARVDRALGQPVVREDRHTRVLGLLHVTRDGVRVHGTQQDDVDAVVDHLPHFAHLLVRPARR